MADYTITIQGNADVEVTVRAGRDASSTASAVAVAVARRHPGEVVEVRADGRLWRKFAGHLKRVVDVRRA